MALGIAKENLAHKPGRTAAVVALVALLALILFGGSIVLGSLERGLASLEDRLGADLIVAPSTAKSTTDLEAIMLEGTPGYFYMDDSYVGRIAERAGVERVSPQYYLATVKAGCCSMPVQIIGIDPETDFTIQPWIARSYSAELGPGDVVAGCSISGAPGTSVLFYGRECRIVAKLDETGTSLDNAVFASGETIKQLIAASEEQGIAVLSDKDPDSIVSTIQVKVAEGASVTEVANDINLHVRGATAVQARQMTSGVADGVRGVARVISAVTGVGWACAAAVLAVTFWVLGRQRVREFAVLRVIGASRAELAGLVIRESLIMSFAGAVAGIALAWLLTLAYRGALESALGLPFLMPAPPQLALSAALALALSMGVVAISAAVSAASLARVDAGRALGEVG